MNYNKITVDELYEQLEQFEETAAEPVEVTESIERVSNTLCNLARSGHPVKIVTDYDADGICSAYIMERTLRAINRNKDFKIDVICNDRRNPYGVPKNLEAEEGAKYIVLDMGSNELDYIRKTFGDDSIIIDHHIISDEMIRNEFTESKYLCNPHSMKCADGKSADYCATGLCYRAYQTLKERNELVYDIKSDNSVAIIACVGTVADCVTKMDEHSYNYKIIKEGMKLIDNADPNNIEFVLGHALMLTGFNEKDCTLKQISFGIAPFLNSAGRMSGVINENGAQLMYDAISGPDNPETYEKLENLCNLNRQRINTVKDLINNDYKMFVNEERGKNIDSNICIYLLPDDTPSAFCGLIAGRITNTVEKATICLTYDSKNDNWVGSARNIEGQTSLNEFMNNIMAKPEAKGIKIEFGGHDNAMGISKLNDAMALVGLVHAYNDLMESKPPIETVLEVNVSELKSLDFMKKIKALEVSGILDKYPCLFEGKETYRNNNFKGNSKTVKVNVGNNPKSQVLITDRFYSELEYPQSEKGEISVLCKACIDNWKEEKVLFEAIFDRDFLKERTKELQVQKSVAAKEPSKTTK